MLFRERQLMNSFKLGDWVIHGKDLHRVLLVDINETNGSYMCIVNIPYFKDTWLPQSKFKRWTPKVGEWVVIADDITPDLYAVFQFNNHSKDRQILPFAFLQTLKDKS